MSVTVDMDELMRRQAKLGPRVEYPRPRSSFPDVPVADASYNPPVLPPSSSPYNRAATGPITSGSFANPYKQSSQFLGICGKALYAGGLRSLSGTLHDSPINGPFCESTRL